MRYILTVMLFVFVIGNIQSRGLGEMAYICTEDNADIYEFFTYGDEENVAMFANYARNAVWYLDTIAHERYRFYALRLDVNDNSSPAFLYVGEELVSIVDIGLEIECLPPYVAPVPHNECLGVNPMDYGLANEGLFMVDNQAYAYNGQLSYLVPLDTVWHWDLYIDGQYILSFEQTEGEVCHILNEDNNG